MFENVKGLTVGRHRAFLEELVAEFEDMGYAVRLPWKVLNAANHGTPQSRERLFVLGARGGVPVPGYPEPTTGIAGRQRSIAGLPDSPTCGDALGDLPDADRHPELLDGDETEPGAFGEPSAYAGEMRCLSNSAWHFGHVRNWDRAILTSSARTRHTEISQRRFAETRPGTVEPISRFFKLHENGVSNTLRAGTDGARGAFTSPPPDPLPPRPLRHGAGDGEAPRLPGLVPPARDQVARRPADRQRRAPAAGQGDRRRGGEVLGDHPGQAVRHGRTR